MVCFPYHCIPILVSLVFLVHVLYLFFFKNYRLNFDSTVNPKNTRWHGAVATIEPRKDWDVWGTVWQLGAEDIPSLDRYGNNIV